MSIKIAKYAGADQNTPSKAQYFSWINSTNEGSDELQTITNLDFFAFLRRNFDMQLDIYAWDAGNLDGASGTYGDMDSPKIKAQYPRGYGPIATAAASLGIRMGVWMGADGYGDTLEQEQKRRELLVKLCRDYNFALFKFDSVGGAFPRAKIPAFIKTIEECRKYCPDLIVLNHRNELRKAEKYVTTALWQGKETYVDVLISNDRTAPHHRAFALTRGNTPMLNRLMEDHGVCLSSCLDYFEDELVVQAFGRSLILAPEIYGNPWLLRDDELPILAGIFRLHRKYRDILVNGKRLPASYGDNAVSRGDGRRRFLCLTNPTWQTSRVTIQLDRSIGLDKTADISVIRRFPTESHLGVYHWGDSVTVEIDAFRAALFEVVDCRYADIALQGADYCVLHEENGGGKLRVRIVSSDGKIYRIKGKESELIFHMPSFENKTKPPVYLGAMSPCPLPANDRLLYETAMFAIDNDSLERQSLKRSGNSEIKEVTAARNAFFGQRTYAYRGCDSHAMFDGKDDTFFDGRSRTYCGGLRVNGGCLRVDLGARLYVNDIEIEYFEADDNDTGVTPAQQYSLKAEYSGNLAEWKETETAIVSDKADIVEPVVIETVHDIRAVKGKLKSARYAVNDLMRYFTLPEPMDRIHSVRVLIKGVSISLPEIRGNNLMAPYRTKPTVACRRLEVTLPEQADEHYIACAIDGKHGVEGVYCVAECDGVLYGFEDRASSYPSNVWEHLVCKNDSNYTYYMRVPKAACGRKITIYALFNDVGAKIDKTQVNVYLCHVHGKQRGVVLDI